MSTPPLTDAERVAYRYLHRNAHRQEASPTRPRHSNPEDWCIDCGQHASELAALLQPAHFRQAAAALTEFNNHQLENITRAHGRPFATGMAHATTVIYRLAHRIECPEPQDAVSPGTLVAPVRKTALGVRQAPLFDLEAAS